VTLLSPYPHRAKNHENFSKKLSFKLYQILNKQINFYTPGCFLLEVTGEKKTQKMQILMVCCFGHNSKMNGGQQKRTSFFRINRRIR
jgi:hypothetical protein